MSTGNAETQLEAVAGRLRKALGGRTITWLQTELDAAGVEGSGYSNVQRYVAGKGKGAPPLEWIDGAARVLGVPAAWLAFGQMPIDAARTSPAETFESAVWGKMLAALTGGASEPLMASLLRRVVEAQPAGTAPPTEKDLHQLANAVQLSVTELTMALRPSDSEGAMQAFVLAVLAAMHAVVPGPGSADSCRSVAEIATLLPRAKGAKS